MSIPITRDLLFYLVIFQYRASFVFSFIDWREEETKINMCLVLIISPPFLSARLSQ